MHAAEENNQHQVDRSGKEGACMYPTPTTISLRNEPMTSSAKVEACALWSRLL